jgi:hypothetical protein
VRCREDKPSWDVGLQVSEKRRLHSSRILWLVSCSLGKGHFEGGFTNGLLAPIATSTGDPSSETEANTSATDSADSTSAGTATEEAQATPTGAAERARSSAWTNIAALFAALVML